MLAEAILHRHRARSAAAASSCRNRRSLVPWRVARARFAPWRTSRPPTEHALRAADLARLSSWPTRDALYPTPLAEAPLNRHCAMSAAAASKRRNRLFLVPWHAARARFVTSRTSRPPTEHALRAACLARLSARPTRDALHPTPLAEAFLNRHRARSAAAASKRRNRLFLVPWRAARALRHVENQPTAHGARTARFGLGAVVCVANSQRAPSHAVGRGSWRRHRARSAAAGSNRRSRLF